MIMAELMRDWVGKRVDIEMDNGTRYENIKLERFDGTYLYINSGETVLHSDEVKYFTLA